MFSCTAEKKEIINAEAPITIDLVEAYKNKESIKLSTIASEITYLRLESKKEAILGGGPRIFVSDSFVVISGFKKIDLFDRASGNYIREIGKIGRGPNEYNSTRHVASFNQKEQFIYARKWEELIAYDLKGKMVKKIKRPEVYKNMCLLEDNLYAAFTPNTGGNETRRVVIYDAIEEKTIKIFPNYQFYKPTSYAVSGYEGWFYHYKNKLFFKEYCNDTLFRVTKEQLLPKFVFNSGEYKVPYRNRENTKYFMTRLFMENSRYLFFNFSYNKHSHCSIFDKKTGNCFISDIDGEKNSGYINDIDNFISFNPQSINVNNELIAFVQAYKLKRWFDENPEKAAKLPPHLQKLKSIKETDNPVVMILKLKE